MDKFVPKTPDGTPLHIWCMYHDYGKKYKCPECEWSIPLTDSTVDVLIRLQPRGVTMFSTMYARVAPTVECPHCHHRNPYWMFCIWTTYRQKTAAEAASKSFEYMNVHSRNGSPMSVISEANIDKDSLLRNKCFHMLFGDKSSSYAKAKTRGQTIFAGFEGDTIDVIPVEGEST